MITALAVLKLFATIVPTVDLTLVVLPVTLPTTAPVKTALVPSVPFSSITVPRDEYTSP